jgi:aryl-alcohol dehydrogenase-like predicted oxidoreductase
MTLGREADEAESVRMVKIALDHGVNFFDTANSYSRGRSEEILGKAVKGIRDQVVLATKVFNPMGDGPNDRGASRYHIVRAVEESLRRFKTDRIDVYQLHNFDPETPLEESLRALDDLVRWGKVVYIGCCNFTAHQVMKALRISKSQGLNLFASVQFLYNILKREAEAKLLPLCMEEGRGVTTWNPLAGGFLTGKYKPGSEPPPGTRLGDQFDFHGDYRYRDRYQFDESFQRMARFLEAAKKRGIHPIALSIAWIASHPAVTCPIIGARNAEQLKETLGLADLKISIEERDQITKEVWC